MELVLPNNYVELEQDEMMYLDGGQYFSKSECGQICAAIGFMPQTYIALAGAAVITSRVIKYIKNGGRLSFLLGASLSKVAEKVGQIAYCIGYGALNNGCDISLCPYPCELFISGTVR